MRALISRALAGAFDDRRVVLVDDDLLGAAQVGDVQVLELDAQAFEHGRAAGQNGDILEHGLAAIAVARRLDGGALERATQLVDDERGQGFAFDVLGNDQQRLAGVNHRLEHRHQFLDVGDLLLVDQDVRVVQDAFHLRRRR